MSTLAVLATLALTNAQRGATPTGHALLLGTQRTGTTTPKALHTVESAPTTLSTQSSHNYSRSSARLRAGGSRDAAAPLNLFVYDGNDAYRHVTGDNYFAVG